MRRAAPVSGAGVMSAGAARSIPRLTASAAGGSHDLAASVADRIDALNEAIGRAVSWLSLAMVLVQFVVVVMRYVFGLGSLYMQHSVVFLNAIVFLVAAG